MSTNEDFAAPISVSALVETDDAHALGVLDSGSALQRAGDGKYMTAIAVQRPRHLPTIERDAIVEATLLGEAAFYGWGAGKDRIQGPSVKMAMALRRIWGNNALAVEPVQDIGDSWVFTSVFIDLEAGCTLARQFRQSKKSIVYGKHDAERKDDIRFQIGASKAARNVILNAIPEWLVERAMVAAKDGVRKRIEAYIATEGIDKARTIAVSALAKSGVAEDRVLAKFGRAAVGALTGEDLIGIKGDLKAIDDGVESPASLYPDAGDTKTTPSAIREGLSKPAGPEKVETPKAGKAEEPDKTTKFRAASLKIIRDARESLGDRFGKILSLLEIDEAALATDVTQVELDKLVERLLQEVSLATTQAANGPTDGTTSST